MVSQGEPTVPFSRQAGRQTDRQTARQADRQTGREAEKRTWMAGWAGRQAGRETDVDGRTGNHLSFGQWAKLHPRSFTINVFSGSRIAVS